MTSQIFETDLFTLLCMNQSVHTVSLNIVAWRILFCYLLYFTLLPNVLYFVTWRILFCYLAFYLFTWYILLGYLTYFTLLPFTFYFVTWHILASCKMDTGSFPRVKYGRGVVLTTHPLLVPRSCKSRTIHLTTLWATPGLWRDHFTFTWHILLGYLTYFTLWRVSWRILLGYLMSFIFTLTYFTWLPNVLYSTFPVNLYGFNSWFYGKISGQSIFIQPAENLQ